MTEKETPQKKSASKKEQEVLSFWRKNEIFEKTLAKKSPKGEFVFYDGPPFATGLPHYGHILSGTLKDVIPRYQTMRGYHADRQWGWDCHGLPLENEIEKELGLETKQDIEKYGIEKFNKKAEENVMRYADDWREFIPRTGRWVDMERDYRTMDWSYTESVWWVFKTLYDKGLIYEGFKSMHLCPRCETTLSNFEVSQGYKDINDIAVYVKFEIRNPKSETNSKSEIQNGKTYLLVWTTTAWTLPGNMAVAVNNEVVYGKFEIRNPKSETKEQVIVAKERAGEILKDKEYEIVEEFTGDKLVGLTYEPPFDYYKDAPLKNKENAWKVYAGDFVTTDEGTGIVHIAPAFGEDDQRLAEENNIPVVHHVGTDGRFKKEIRDFAGELVKPKDPSTGSGQEARLATDVLILKNLVARDLLFAKEKITHSYPFCWRCDTPLLNYAASSWFVKVTEIKDALIKANKKINWVPRDIRDGRFGKWLEGARDWAISRSRFWGAPIPAWRCSKCERVETVGSLAELQEKSADSGNTYFLMRHGEARSNKEGFVNSAIESSNGLTEKGKKETDKAAKFLGKQDIDLIIASPLQRTKGTARRVAGHIGVKKEKIIFADEIREIGTGDFEGRSIDEWRAQFSSVEEKFIKRPPEGENLEDVKKRVMKFLYDIDKKYADKKILIISHADAVWMMHAGMKGMTRKQAIASHGKKEDFLKTGEVKKMAFAPLPHDENFHLDIHRPHIDAVRFKCPCGGRMKRVPEVFDCWFESGSMPYGQHHYPFENTDVFEPKKKRGFPADFIAEGLDQTRGWFYSLLVLGVALFGERAYKNVVVNGLILAEDGRKMSKRLKNYPEPTEILDRYGADALRLYLLSSPVVRAEDLRFSEEGVKETQNKIVTRLRNVIAFYELYAGEGGREEAKSTHVLDTWIRVRMTEVVNKVTDAMERYELDKAVRPIEVFIDDFSTWYLRRSRERFKSSDANEQMLAISTTRFILSKFAKVMAPFAPFVAEEAYRAAGGSAESVHLEIWPKYESRFPIWPNPMALFHRIFRTSSDVKILQDMEEVRRIVSLALEARANEGIRVRQPLSVLKIKNEKSKIKGNEDLLQLIRDEVNVKEIVFDGSVEDEVALDTELTTELHEEGMLRELVRAVQDLRKKKGLTPGDSAVLLVKVDGSARQFVEKFEKELRDATTLSAIEFKDGIGGEKIEIDKSTFTVSLKS